jgi:hypothetical protein
LAGRTIDRRLPTRKTERVAVEKNVVVVVAVAEKTGGLVKKMTVVAVAGRMIGEL